MGFFAGNVDLTSPGPIGSTTPNTGAFTTLSANNGTLTSSSPAFTLAQTWNNASTIFTALRTNITNTASNISSLLIDLQIGGSSMFSIRRDGQARGNGMYSVFRAYGYEAHDGAVTMFFVNPFTGNVGINTSASIQWGTGAAPSNNQGDTKILRDAAGVLALQNGTNAQTFRLYNTFTDASNYERGFFRWNTNVLEIGAEAAGTGTQRQLRLPLGTVTASTPLSVTQTWNSSGVTFTGIQANITDTASASGSLLMDLQVGGSSKAVINKSGGIQANVGQASSGFGFTFLGGTNGIYSPSASGSWYLAISASAVAEVRSSGIGLGSGSLSWGPIGSTQDVILTRDAASILAQRNSTNAQTFRLYRTYTDASNYERLGFLATNTARYTITSENAGTGSARSLEVSFYTAASDPTSTDITSGCFSVWKNSGTGTIKLWANDGGTMKSVALA